MLVKNIEDFEENCYYKVEILGVIYYFKFKCIVHGSIDYYWDIMNGVYTNSNLRFSFTGYNRKFYKVDINEIIQYLPSGHPDIVEYRKQRIKKLLWN